MALNIGVNSSSRKTRTELEFTVVEIASNCSLGRKTDRIFSAVLQIKDKYFIQFSSCHSFNVNFIGM